MRYINSDMLRHLFEVWKEIEEKAGNDKGVYCYNECINAIDKMSFDDVVEVIHGEWVSCDERLPEEKGEYLVSYHPCYWDNVDKEVMVGMDTFRGKTKWAKKKYQRVIAWMPKPNPYVERK